MFHKKLEGIAPKPGFNWCWDKASRPMLVVKLGKLLLFYRRRTKFIMDANPEKRRHIFEVDWVN